MMQTAWLATSVEEARRAVRAVGGLSRLYFGHETCPWRFPGEDEVRQARALAAAEGLGFTLVTPPIPQSRLDGFLQRLESFRPAPGDEVVFNDIGLLHAAAASSHPATRVMGRLLLP